MGRLHYYKYAKIMRRRVLTTCIENFRKLYCIYGDALLLHPLKIVQRFHSQPLLGISFYQFIPRDYICFASFKNIQELLCPNLFGHILESMYSKRCHLITKLLKSFFCLMSTPYLAYMLIKALPSMKLFPKIPWLKISSWIYLPMLASSVMSHIFKEQT